MRVVTGILIREGLRVLAGLAIAWTCVMVACQTPRLSGHQFEPAPVADNVGGLPAFSEYTSYAQSSLEYQRAWSHVEYCSGVHGDIRPWRFFVTMTPVFNVNGKGPFVGYTFLENKNILMGLYATGDSLIVEHEMLHALLNEPGHPDTYFPSVEGYDTSTAKCKGVVLPVLRGMLTHAR